MTPLNLLTLARPGAFLDMLGHLGHRWDVVAHGRQSAAEPWLLARELPAAMRSVHWLEARARLERHDYDAVVCHQIRHFVEVRSIAPGLPVVLHANPRLETAFGISCHLAAAALGTDRHETTCVFDSYHQRRAWAEAAVGGEVIAPGLDVESYGPYDGSIPCMLTIGNLQSELPAMSGFDSLEQLAAGLPLTVLGHNPGLGLHRPLLSRRERLRALCSHRLYLNTSVGPTGDGENLHVLEAMASGMPVVTRTDPATPVVHGTHGYVGTDPARLRLLVLELLEDRDLALRLGQAARDTIAREYPVARFVRTWNALLERVVEEPGSAGRELRQISA